MKSQCAALQSVRREMFSVDVSSRCCRCQNVASEMAGCSTGAVRLQQNFCHRSCCFLGTVRVACSNRTRKRRFMCTCMDLVVWNKSYVCICMYACSVGGGFVTEGHWVSHVILSDFLLQIAKRFSFVWWWKTRVFSATVVRCASFHFHF